MLRQPSPKSQIYAAIGALAQEAISITDVFQTQGICHSLTHKGKNYHILYNPQQKTITANDGITSNRIYLGYPAIAFLIKRKALQINPQILHHFQGLPREEISIKSNKQEEEKLRILLGILFQQGINMENIEKEGENILHQIIQLKLKKPEE